MGDLPQILSELERALRERLPAEQHARIPAVLALLERFSAPGTAPDDGRAPAGADLTLVPLLQEVETLSPSMPGVNFSGAQVGDVAIGEIARSIIHNTIILSTNPADAAAHFADGIEALQAIIRRTPAANEALAVFRDRLAAVRRQVSALINLKLLHDLVHGLQYRSLPMLVRELRRFPGDDDAVGSIEQCAIDLRDVHGQIEGLMANASFEAPDVEWRDTLPKVAAEIDAGLAGRDAPRIDRAARHIKSVVNTRLSRINTNLVQRAALLQAADLAAPLRSLHDRLADLEIEAGDLERVDNGIDGMAQLHRLLTAMVFVHNSWQELDDELNRIEPTLRADAGELEFSWPYLHPKIERVCQSEEAWALEIRSAVGQLTQALAETGELKIRRAFDRLQNRVGHRFFTVDLDLKTLCGRLRDFRDPLDTLGVVP